MANPKQHRGWILVMLRVEVNGTLTLALKLGLGVALLAAQAANAQAYTVLHNFIGKSDGARPDAGLIRDKTGTFYGITSQGGPGAYGTVFSLDTTGREIILHSFVEGGTDGGFPGGTLVRDKHGNLYGTTAQGGVGDSYGIVFKLDKTNKETIVHNFVGATDGRVPAAGLILDADGNLYGTTIGGGVYGYGTVFKVNKKGIESVFYSFAGTPDGSAPSARLLRDAEGNLYGTTASGGGTGCDTGWPGCGTVFKLDRRGRETILHKFTDSDGDGGVPYAGLVQDDAGTLYGTTWEGDTYNYGTVFSLDQAGKETVLYNFTGGPDGGDPTAELVRDDRGNLYGTTLGGYGLGTIFCVNQSGKMTVLHRFNFYTDGNRPTAGLFRDADGSLYGTTSDRGDNGNGYGTVFKLIPSISCSSP